MENKNIKSIQILIDQIFRIIKQQEKHKTQFITVAISQIDNKGVYYGKINGQIYSLPNGTNMTFKLADKVIVCIPDNDYKRKFILCKNPDI